MSTSMERSGDDFQSKILSTPSKLLKAIYDTT